ncbi:MAG: acetyl-CoA carboxylase biotin carboxylase subunit [Alphaproteobacteria bacterium]|nr:acetyl-CoA carboxylase biotin carboxylase subunit [Alphaproteobacteria bacterium]
MFNKILIANRGEIAIRILRACKELGIKTVAVHSEIDSSLMHVKFADESVCIGPNSSSQSYLNISSILSAAEVTGADAIHPGVGFLSENAHFARMVSEHNITFIGPSADHLSMMGDKIIAKKTMQNLGIPVVNGSEGVLEDVEVALQQAEKIGYPVIIKAALGGGGKGMKVSNTPDELRLNFKLAKSEAKINFGSDAIYLEKYLVNPKHIEMQIICDDYGNVLFLGERECSIQRNNQKLMEESPSTVLNDEQRYYIGEILVKAFKQIGYSGVATVEFLYDNGQFFFMEVNPRLQVEHSVTEQTTGIDIVKEQIKIASGEELSIKQSDIKIKGHAIEFRINAEDSKTFMPCPGKIEELYFPGGNGIRIDSHIYRNYVVPQYYDSLLAKLIVYANTREECLNKALCALDELVIDGINTTIELHKKLIKENDIREGKFDIHWLEKNIDRL